MCDFVHTATVEKGADEAEKAGEADDKAMKELYEAIGYAEGQGYDEFPREVGGVIILLPTCFQCKSMLACLPSVNICCTHTLQMYPYRNHILYSQ